MTIIELLDKIKQEKSIRNDLLQNWNNKNKVLLVGNYKIVSYISKGSFGQVYKVQHKISGKTFALKIIDFQLIFQKNSNPKIRQKIERYLITEQTLMRKCHSAYVVKVYEVFQNKKCKIFILEYCNGGSLDDYIKRRKALQEGEAIIILRQIIFGLAQLHRNCIIHRDLKPANILIHKGIFKLADLGFSKELPNEQFIGNNSLCGSKNTMAPEVQRCQPYGLKADIWSLGMIFFLMTFFEEFQDVYQNRYRKGLQIAGLNAPFLYETIDNNRLSKEASDFLKRTLAIDRSKRINWLQTLDHPIFKKQNQRLPSIFIAEEDQKFKQLHQQHRQDSQFKIFDTREFDLKDLQKLRQQDIQINFEDDENQDKINQQYLQCRKAEFIYSSIIRKLEQKHLLDCQNRKHVELLYLLSARCFMNISFALDTVERLYTRQSFVFIKFKAVIRNLQQKIIQKFYKYSKSLTKIEGKVTQILADSFTKFTSKISPNKDFEKKKVFLEGCQNIDFRREEQINFTYKYYVIELINDVKGNDKDEKYIKKIFKAYNEINRVTVQELGMRNFEKFIEDVIEEQDK